MAMKSRPFALSLLTLTLFPFYASAASPWAVTDGSTLQVTSGYDSTSASDKPLVASGLNSRLSTDSGLTFSLAADSSKVAAVTDQASMTLNEAVLAATGANTHAVYADNATIIINGNTLSTDGSNSVALLASNSDVTIGDSNLLTSGNASVAMRISGGTLTVNNVVIESSESINNLGIELSQYTEATLNDVQINVNGSEASHAMNINAGYVTGTNVTINSGSTRMGAIRAGNGSGARSTLTLTDSEINSAYIGIRAMNSDMTLTNVNVTTNGTSGSALDINMDSDTVVRGGTYQTSGIRSHGVSLMANTTTLDAANVSFITSGDSSHAVYGFYGAVTIADSTLTTSGTDSDGLYTEATVAGTRLTISTSGQHGYGARADNGRITLDDSTITTTGANAFGLASGVKGIMTLTNTPITTSGDGASGVYIFSSSDVTLNNSPVVTSGFQAHGVYAASSAVNLSDTSLTTAGASAYGMTLASSTSTIANSTIATTGAEAAGIYAQQGSVVTANNLTLSTAGDNAAGLITSLSTLNLTNSTVTTAGTGDQLPVALYATGSASSSNNNVTLDNVSLTSQAGTSVLAIGTALNMTLSNNSLIYGGGGTAISVTSQEATDGTVTHSKLNVTADASSQLLGDVITNSYDNEINLSLKNASVLNGATQNVNQLILDATSSWLVTGDSNVNALKLYKGSVIFNNASQFSTLTINGNLTESGSFTLNTQLGDDSSPTDKIVVNGDASGDYNMYISNRGGTGGTTNAGILVVQVDGDASNAKFTQQGTIVAGNYEYMLNKIGDNTWYLQTSLTPETPVTPQTPADNGAGGSAAESGDVVVTPGVKAYRPETAGYLIAPYLNAAYGFETIGTWHERLGAYQGGTVWARVSGRHDNYDAGRFSFDVNTTFVQFGGDLLNKSLSDGWHLTAGPMVTLGHQKSNNKDTARSLRAELSVDVGKTTTDAYGIGGYLTAWNDDGVYLDNVLQVTRYSNNFSSLTNAKMDSYGVVASMETGIPISLGGQFKLEPQLQAMGQYMNISQTYSSGVKLKDQNLMTAQLREGLRLYYDNPTLKPYLQADVVQFLGHTPGVDMNNETLTPDVRRGYWQAGAGLSSQLNSHLSAYMQVKYSHSFGPGTEGYTGNMGVRYKF